VNEKYTLSTVPTKMSEKTKNSPMKIEDSGQLEKLSTEMYIV
jgi:hypothetical protein